MALPRCAVLFDVDGVIMRNKPIMKRVELNCARFVQRTSLSPIELNVAYQTNTTLYKTHGHTLRGLYKKYGKPPPYDHRMTDLFTSEVYNASLYDELAQYVYSKDFARDSEGFAEICMLCKENNMPVAIFSNAPSEWCDIVLDAVHCTHGSAHMSLVNYVYTSSHKVMRPHYFKPDAEVYANVVADIKDKKYNNNIKEFVFIDDSLTNLQPIRKHPSWVPVLFDEDANKPIPKPRPNDIRVVQSMKDIHEFIQRKATQVSLVAHEPLRNLYLVHDRVKNVATVKMILRSCVPHLSELMLERIIIDANKNGKALITQCTRIEANEFAVCMIENGFVIDIEEAE